jgi:pyruvate formate lyase activating enzyme
MEDMKALVFNIQRYSLHDGNGIRTIVFFKGCPLHCPWCCNPESQSFEIENLSEPNECSGRFSPNNGRVYGKYMTIDEIIKEVEKDRIFYNTSGGGVTLSGGEVLSQGKFAIELLRRLKKLSIDTVIETSGSGNSEILLEMSKYLDTILFDLKIMDKLKAKKIIGIDIESVKNNMKLLVENKKRVIPRIPLIPGYTMDKENINEIIKFVKSLDLKEVHILPFHQYGSKKYEYLKRQYDLKDVDPPDIKLVDNIKKTIESHKIKVVVGGM